MEYAPELKNPDVGRALAHVECGGFHQPGHEGGPQGRAVFSQRVFHAQDIVVPKQSSASIDSERRVSVRAS